MLEGEVILLTVVVYEGKNVFPSGNQFLQRHHLTIEGES